MTFATHPLTESIICGIKDWVLIDECGYDPDLGTWLRQFRSSVTTIKQIRSGNIQAMFQQAGADAIPFFSGNIWVVDHRDAPNANIPLIQYLELDRKLLEALREIDRAICPQCSETLTRETAAKLTGQILERFNEQLISITGSDNRLIDEVRATPANKMRIHDSLALGLDGPEGAVRVRAESNQELLGSRNLCCKQCGFIAPHLSLTELREEFAAKAEGFWNKTGPFKEMLTSLRQHLNEIGLDHIEPGSRLNSLAPADRLRLYLLKALPSLEPETLLVLDTPSAWLNQKSAQSLFDWIESKISRLLVIDNRTRYSSWPGTITPGKPGEIWPVSTKDEWNGAMVISPVFGEAEGQKTVAKLSGLEKALADFFSKLPVSLVRGYNSKDFQEAKREGLADVGFKGLRFSEILGLDVINARDQLVNVPPVAKVLNILIDFDLGQIPLNLLGNSLRKAEVLRLRLAKLALSRPKDVTIGVDQCQLLSARVKSTIEANLESRGCKMLGKDWG